ncbi:MAG: hypothetical protein WBW32_10805 [Luteibacter sp.]
MMDVIRAHLVGGRRDRRVFTLLSRVSSVLSPVDSEFYEYRLVRTDIHMPDGWPKDHYLYVDAGLSEIAAHGAVASYLAEWADAHPC